MISTKSEQTIFHEIEPYSLQYIDGFSLAIVLKREVVSSLL